MKMRALLLLVLTLIAGGAHAQQATVVVSFDYHTEALTVALPIMKERQLPATFYVAVTTNETDLIDNPDYPFLPSSAQLAEAQQNGWEIGLYSNRYMTTMLGPLAKSGGGVPTGADPNALAVKQFMLTQKAKLHAKGFEAKSFVPAGRAWNTALANLSRDVFDNVRVLADGPGYQTYPIPDLHYVRLNGGAAALEGSHTAAGLCSKLNDLIEAGPVLWAIVAHKIGPVADRFTMLTAEFTGFMDCLATARNAGLLRVLTWSQAMKAP